MRVFYFLSLVFFIIDINCKKELSPEEQIRKNIEQMVEYANKRQIGKIMDFISNDYKDNYGNKRDSIKAILIQNLMFRKNVKVYLKNIDVKIENQIGFATIGIIVKEGEGILPDNADIMRIDLKFANMENQWLIISAIWKGHQSPF